MEPKELLELMNALDRKLLEAPGLTVQARVCDLDIQTQTTAQGEVLAQILADYTTTFPNSRGWLCRQSDVVQFRAGRCPLEARVQYGELVGDAFHSLHIRPDGVGGWKVITLTERDGQTYLAVPHRHVGRRRGPGDGAPVGDLFYWTYWCAEEPLGYRPQRTRLAGIGEEEETCR